jgi:hypothetical protein
LQHLVKRPEAVLRYVLNTDPCDSPDGCDSEAAGDVPMRRFAAVVIVAEMAAAVACWRQSLPAGGLLEMAMSLAGVSELRHRDTQWPPPCRRPVTCSCGTMFVVPVDWRALLKSNGHDMPTRCPDCRESRRQQCRGEFTCDCGAPFDILPDERAWLQDNGYETPTHCKDCRFAKKHAEADEVARGPLPCRTQGGPVQVETSSSRVETS